MSYQNVQYFAEYIFKYVFSNEKFCILIEISLNFVLNSPINKESTSLQQVMA